MSLFDAVGCAACSGTGYRGRVGLYRWMPLTPDIARAVHSHAADTELEALASNEGWPAIASDAARYLADGTTSLSEVLRVVTA